jgi:hypothetical protein
MPTASRIPARPRSGRRRVACAGAAAALALVPLAGCAPVHDVRGNWHLVAGSDSAGDLGVGDAGDGMLAAVVPGTLPCEDGGLEARYLQDLARVSSLEVDDGHLIASGPDDVRLEYAERSRG